MGLGWLLARVTCPQVRSLRDAMCAVVRIPFLILRGIQVWKWLIIQVPGLVRHGVLLKRILRTSIGQSVGLSRDRLCKHFSTVVTVGSVVYPFIWNNQSQRHTNGNNLLFLTF